MWRVPGHSSSAPPPPVQPPRHLPVAEVVCPDLHAGQQLIELQTLWWRSPKATAFLCTPILSHQTSSKGYFLPQPAISSPHPILNFYTSAEAEPCPASSSYEPKFPVPGAALSSSDEPMRSPKEFRR